MVNSGGDKVFVDHLLTCKSEFSNVSVPEDRPVGIGQRIEWEIRFGLQVYAVRIRSTGWLGADSLCRGRRIRTEGFEHISPARAASEGTKFTLAMPLD